MYVVATIDSPAKLSPSVTLRRHNTSRGFEMQSSVLRLMGSGFEMAGDIWIWPYAGGGRIALLSCSSQAVC